MCGTKEKPHSQRGSLSVQEYLSTGADLTLLIALVWFYVPKFF